MKGVALIFGLSITGKSVIDFFNHINKKDFFIYDNNPEKISSFSKLQIFNINQDFRKINFVIISPGIYIRKNPLLKKFIANKIPIISDLDLFFHYKPKNIKTICVTGTNGKSTTTSLIEHILNINNINSIAIGNNGIGVLDALRKKDIFQYYIIECSSYQLEISSYLQFDYSILLNITKDHIKYHGSFKKYILAKEKALLYASKQIICADDIKTKKIASSFPKIIKISAKNINLDFAIKKNIIYVNKSIQEKLDPQKMKSIINPQNIIAAFSVANLIGLNKIQIIQAIYNFESLKHRIQSIATISSILFLNDSKATTVESTINALNLIQKNLVLIAGNTFHVGNFSNIPLKLRKYIKKVFLIGENPDPFIKDLQNLNINFLYSKNMQNAVNDAFDFAKIHNISIVLFSPIGKSFDQYKNFEERGDDFIKCVSKIN